MFKIYKVITLLIIISLPLPTNAHVEHYNKLKRTQKTQNTRTRPFFCNVGVIHFLPEENIIFCVFVYREC